MQCAAAAVRMLSPGIACARVSNTASASSSHSALSSSSSRGTRTHRTRRGASRGEGCLVSAMGAAGAAGGWRKGPRLLSMRPSRAVSRRGRKGPAALRAALPDEISGLSYRGSNAVVSQLSARGGDNPQQQQLKRGQQQQQQQPSGAAAAATVTVTGGGWPLIGCLALVSLTSVAVCGAVFMLVMAPALKCQPYFPAMTSASIAAEKAAINAEKAMEEFEKLSVQTSEELPKALAEVEAAGKEWDELGEELRELLGRVERWGQFSGAEAALSKLTSTVLDEPTRVIETSMDEAESYIKRLSDDFNQAVNQLSGWERELKASVEQAAFSEAWEKDKGKASKRLGLGDGKGKSTKTKKLKKLPSDYNKPSSMELETLADLADVAERRRTVALKQRKVVRDAIAMAEAATQQARVASQALLNQGPRGGAGSLGAYKAGVAREVGVQAESVTSALKDALQAVEEAKEAAAGASFDSWDEDEYEEEAEEGDEEGGLKDPSSSVSNKVR